MDHSNSVDVTSLGYGFALGIVASLIAWRMVVMYYTPRLKISALNRLPTEENPCGFRYRIKIQNRSHLYRVADLSFQARIVIRGLNKQRPNVQTSLLLPISELPPYPVFDPRPFPLLDPRKRRTVPEDYERVYTLRVHELKGAAPAMGRLSEKIRSGLQDRTLTLDDLLREGSDAFVRVAVTSSHAVSGFRKTYSKKFRRHHIQGGEFKQPGVGVKQQQP